MVEFIRRFPTGGKKLTVSARARYTEELERPSITCHNYMYRLSGISMANLMVIQLLVFICGTRVIFRSLNGAFKIQIADRRCADRNGTCACGCAFWK